MTTIIALPIACAGNPFTRAGNYFAVVSGVVSTAFGLFLVYQIGWADGLFGSQVHWTPQ